MVSAHVIICASVGLKRMDLSICWKVRSGGAINSVLPGPESKQVGQKNLAASWAFLDCVDPPGVE